MDLWPLYLLHEDPITVNAAIDLYATAVVERGAGDGIAIVSRDRGLEARFADRAALRGAIRDRRGDLEYLERLAAHFLADGPERAVRITTDCMAPAGSGLGGSSALGIATAAALDRATGRGLDPDRLLALTRAIETQVLRIPTGEQDYHPALRGGTLALHYTVEGTRVERLAVSGAALLERIVLVFSGQSRSSGISNWDVLKRHLDGDATVRSALDAINRAAHAMRAALRASAWDDAGRALADEWNARKRLSPMVTTGAIDALIEAAGREGAMAGKVCGAGGGGCVVFWVKAGRRDAVRSSLERAGAMPLDVRFVDAGVEVTES